MSGEVDLTGLVEKVNKRGTKYFENVVGDIVVKVCTKCGSVKYVDDFNKDRGKVGGRRNECKVCNRIQMKQSRNNNIEKRRDYDREYYQVHRGDLLNYAEEYRGMHRERINTYFRERYKEKSKDEEFMKNKRRSSRMYKRSEDGREASRAYSRKRRTLIRGLEHDWSLEDERKVLDAFKKKCALSGDVLQGGNLSLDHAIPLAVGRVGTKVENMYPLRLDLNSSKQDHCLFDWFADNRDRFGLEQKKFDELIEYLAEINDMTTKEYEEYVRWCHDNPRDLTIQDEYDEGLTKTS